MTAELLNNPREGSHALRPAGQARVLAFIADGATEQVLRDGLGEASVNGLDIRRGNVKTAVAVMSALPTPEVLIVDISGEDQPALALAALSDVVEPGVVLLVIGDSQDVSLYRQMTRELGAMEYIFKPINRDAVARYFAPFISLAPSGADTSRGGRVIAVIGARGGVGATTLAANLAWYLGVIENRHTVFVDADLYLGSGALLLGAKTGPGLRLALESPTRIDPLFVDRSVQHVAGRLNILAGQEKLGSKLNYAAGAAQRLIEALRARHNYIILDLPFLPMPFNEELLQLNHHRVIVSDPSLAGMRDTLRLLELPHGIWQPQRPTTVLNRQGRAGTLTRREMEAGAKIKFDVVIDDLPVELNEAANLGEPAVASKGAFRTGIAALAHEVGFIGGQYDSADGLGHLASLMNRLEKMMPGHG